ncbi:response regulator transcription factor [Sulfurimonas sp. MAG313]|nr:response regulator transcription factor [Sulfurimonas sp. MAG313]MDF1880152.1 response regulator transcription factor [Sulfurimonas sp. MAG313]
MSIKILLLEDDLLFAQSLEDFLDEEGYEVKTVHNPNTALDLTYTQKFDLYLLDINLPIMNGIEFLDALRQSGDLTPAIFLTSYQDKDVMKEGFLKGCDDYLKKPVDLEELHLRIGSVMKRYKGERKQCINDICIDIEQKRVYKNGRVLEVTLREFELISLLFRNKDKVVSKEMIMNTLWSNDEEGSDGAIRVYINRLKKVLEVEALKNVRGLGYIYESS